jgi:hypothetical protein
MMIFVIHNCYLDETSPNPTQWTTMSVELEAFTIEPHNLYSTIFAIVKGCALSYVQRTL